MAACTRPPSANSSTSRRFSRKRIVFPWILVYCTWFGLSMILQTYLLCVEKAGLLSVSHHSMSALSALCRNMFMRASAQVLPLTSMP